MESVPKNALILAADDDVGLLMSVKLGLMSAGLPEPALVSAGNRVIDLVRKNRFRLVLLDLLLPDADGLNVLGRLKEEFPEVECVIITGMDEAGSAVQAMKYGAYDYLVKPLDWDRLIIVVSHALERYSLRSGLDLYRKSQTFAGLKNPGAFAEMAAEDEKMALVFHQAEMAAPTDYNLLITGETGTGKEMLAGIIHRLSPRSSGPFVGVNMASIAKTLFEKDFFGHAKGAFTGAVGEQKGFFESAQGGTLFLDEVAELDLDLQPKLLRVIQEKELYRLGSTAAGKTDVRIIASSNQDLRKQVNEGRFRSDLFHRLNMFHIHIPPLRERKQDISLLARHFLKISARQTGKNIEILAPDLTERLLDYPFPGNVRELANIIRSAVIMEKGPVLSLAAAADFPPFSAALPNESRPPAALAEMERRHILEVLEAAGGNKTQAAKILDIGLRTLQRKLQHYSTSK